VKDLIARTEYGIAPIRTPHLFVTSEGFDDNTLWSDIARALAGLIFSGLLAFTLTFCTLAAILYTLRVLTS